MIFAWPSERSTYHTTCVNRVKSHLKRFCTTAGKEHGFVSGSITDAWGYDKVTNTIYFCEIKVNPNDLKKAITQIHIPSTNYKPKHPNAIIIPVIAIPKKLALGLAKYKPLDWQSFRSLCKTNHIAIWIIEQSNIRQIQGPKPKAAKKKVKKTSIKSKTTKRKTTSKAKATKVRKLTTKPKSKTKPKTKSRAKTVNRRKPILKKKAVRTKVKKR